MLQLDRTIMVLKSLFEDLYNPFGAYSDLLHKKKETIMIFSGGKSL